MWFYELKKELQFSDETMLSKVHGFDQKCVDWTAYFSW